MYKSPNSAQPILNHHIQTLDSHCSSSLQDASVQEDLSTTANGDSTGVEDNLFHRRPRLLCSPLVLGALHIHSNPWRPPPLRTGFPGYSIQAWLVHQLKALGGHLHRLQIWKTLNCKFGVWILTHKVMFYFLTKNTPRLGPAQPVSTGNSSQSISVGDDTNESDCPSSGKHLLFTKEEDVALVGAWLNNSNDPIHSNYKKNEQYWKEVMVAYNSPIPKNRARQLKQVKDRFGRIKKRVAWFCGNWKEANALWASGESDADLMKKALKLYEEEHKKDGPFGFTHCWEVLQKEPKWDAYLERLAELDPDKRKYNVDDDVEQHFSVQDDDKKERLIGGKKAKELQKRKRKDEACIIDFEDELQIFIDTQNKASEGRKEMPGTQKRVSSENLEARKLSYLAAKENKESAMLETHRELLKQDTTVMAEDVRSEHVLALRCIREKLFGNTN